MKLKERMQNSFFALSDNRLLGRKKIALSYVDIDLLDYILYCEEDYYSYSDNGKL